MSRVMEEGGQGHWVYRGSELRYKDHMRVQHYHDFLLGLSDVPSG